MLSVLSTSDDCIRRLENSIDFVWQVGAMRKAHFESNKRRLGAWMRCLHDNIHAGANYGLLGNASRCVRHGHGLHQLHSPETFGTLEWCLKLDAFFPFANRRRLLQFITTFSLPSPPNPFGSSLAPYFLASFIAWVNFKCKLQFFIEYTSSSLHPLYASRMSAGFVVLVVQWDGLLVTYCTHALARHTTFLLVNTLRNCFLSIRLI